MEPTRDLAAQWRVTSQPFRLTPQGKRLIEKAVPAWEEAQRRASELLGNEGISLLDKAARKVGMSPAGR
jgi:hypothetical protein